jgi:bacteriocin-like protein
MAEMDKNEQAKGKIAESNASTQARLEPGELTDEELDKVSGGQGAEFTSVSNVLKTRHDTAKNSISNIR